MFFGLDVGELLKHLLKHLSAVGKHYQEVATAGTGGCHFVGMEGKTNTHVELNNFNRFLFNLPLSLNCNVFIFLKARKIIGVPRNTLLLGVLSSTVLVDQNEAISLFINVLFIICVCS